MNTVTQEGMVPRQPGMCVSYRTNHSTGVTTLAVFRSYDCLTNQFGGRGRFKHCDHYGLEFSSPDAARQFAIDHGYVRPYFTSPSLRERRKAEARNPNKTKKEA